MAKANSELSEIAQSPLQKVGVACLLPVPELDGWSPEEQNWDLGLVVVRVDQSPIILPNLEWIKDDTVL